MTIPDKAGLYKAGLCKNDTEWFKSVLKIVDTDFINLKNNYVWVHGFIPKFVLKLFTLTSSNMGVFLFLFVIIRSFRIVE